LELAQRLRSLELDRVPPTIEVVELKREGLNKLVRKTRVLINGLGPYHRYSSSRRARRTGRTMWTCKWPETRL
jgi:short subunit dehydrogenase-like uncharacterized protein